MLRDLLRILPPTDRRDLRLVALWLGAAAVLHGVALGLAGLLVQAVVDAHDQVASAAVALAVAVVAFAVVQWHAQMRAFGSGTELGRTLHEALGRHVSELPLGWFTPARHAQVVGSATSGAVQLMSYPALLLRPAMTALVTPVAAALVLALLDWRCTLAALLCTVVALGASRTGSVLAARVDARRHTVDAEATSRLLEYATRQQTIRTDGTDEAADDLHRALADVRGAAARASGTVLPGLLLFTFALTASFAALVALGALRVGAGTLGTGAFVGGVVVLARMSAVASTGGELMAALRLQRGDLDRLSDVLTSAPLPVAAHPGPIGPGPIGPGPGFVRFDGVHFAYEGTEVLHGVDLTLPHRGLTVLVGPSGAGKTTLVRLLARFWDPTAGTVRIGGTDLRALPPEELYRGLATVLQDDHLLDVTLGENIRAGRPDATGAQVSAAVDAAGLTGTVAALPDGLDSRVGPGGANLSGGQRQRVCVARALLKAAPLTLLDEATAALDPQNRRIVVDAALALARTGCVLLITHDLAVAALADQVVVLHAGRVVQQGPPADLAAADGPFARLARGADVMLG